MSLETSQQVAQLPRVPALTYLSDGWWPGSVSQTKSFLPSLLLVRVFYHSNTNKAVTCFETLSQSKSLSLNCFCGAFGYHDERGSFLLLNFISQERWTGKRRAAGPGKGTGKWGWCMFRNFFFVLQGNERFENLTLLHSPGKNNPPSALHILKWRKCQDEPTSRDYDGDRMHHLFASSADTRHM